ncbi:MAG: hypothetical protein EZS28_008108 [Streblomastix strix]|uniref:Uncharacterized protein n=1 Tax=Streblomastix strix TaxID=222440 RepID=A0A5J4WP08_9EUKA|nr:MAG: hypothetical protein EZS28_008108 [Streblomastix strix]
MVSKAIKKANYQIEVAGRAYVSLVSGGRGEERFIAKKSLSEYVRKQGGKAEDISHIVEVMSRPLVTFYICIISWCNTSIPVNNFASSSSKLIRVTESAPCIGQKSEDEIFEPLWDRELRNGKMRTGLVVAREETSPLIKEYQIKFINCDGIKKNIYDPKRLRIADSEKGQEERKWIQAEFGKRDAEDKAGIAEQKMKDSEEQIVLIESIKNKKQLKWKKDRKNRNII